MGKRKSNEKVRKIHEKLRKYQEKLDSLLDISEEEKENRENEQEWSSNGGGDSDHESAILGDVREASKETSTNEALASIAQNYDSSAHDEVVVTNDDDINDLEILNIMGEDPKLSNAKEVKLHVSLTNRWSHWIANGLKIEQKQEILEKYKKPLIFEPPKLNEEFSTAAFEKIAKRDGYFRERQQLLGSALVALGSALTSLIEEKESVDKLKLVDELCDAGKLISEVMFEETKARKAFVTPGIKDKEIIKLTSSAKTDEYLFGKDLTERVKGLNEALKIGQKLKNSSQNYKQMPLQQKQDLNYKSLQGYRPYQAGYTRPQGSGRPKLFFRGNRQQQPFNPRVQNQGRPRPKTQGNFNK